MFRKNYHVLALTTFVVLLSLAPIEAAVPVGNVTLQFEDINGNPLNLGTSGWEVGDARSTKNYPVTALGKVTFLNVPLKAGSVTLVGAKTKSGNFVTKNWSIDFSDGNQTLAVPTEPQMQTLSVKVVLPNGQPVVGALVSSPSLRWGYQTRNGLEIDPKSSDNNTGCWRLMEDWCEPEVFDNELKINDIFVVNPLVSHATSRNSEVAEYTNEMGVAILRGFSLPNIESYSGNVLLEDPTMTQEVSFEYSVDTKQIEVELNYMPWLEVDSQTFTANQNSLVTIPVAINSVVPLSIGYSTHPSATISVNAPPESRQKTCKGTVLKTKTNAVGKAKLKVCADISGYYEIKSKGAVSFGSVLIKVKNTSPMAPSDFSSLSDGSNLAIAWNQPLYSGGAKISGYTLVATSGKITKTFKINTKKALTSGSYVLKGLKPNRVWFLTLTPKNKFGFGASLSISAIH